MGKTRRPKETQGICIRKMTGCGKLYVTTGEAEGKLLEIFASLGKAGGCAKAQLEALTRSISLGLKYGVPLEEYIDELIGIRCPSPNLIGNPEEEVLSCIDAIAKVLRDFNKPKKAVVEK